MKRSVAVCIVAAFLVATSTAAFAGPITVTQSGDVLFDNTMDSGFTKAFAGDHSSTITWSQSPEFTVPAADFSAYPAGGTLSGPTVSITSATLTIVANGVNPGQTVTVWRGPNPPGAWDTPQIGTLTQSTAWNGATDSTTSISLGAVSLTGLSVQVRAPGSEQNVVVKTSRLQGTAHWSYEYTYEEPAPPPAPVPAPGAILLASMGAGLISWLRARKAL